MKNSGLHRAGGNADDRGDFVDGMALHGGEQKNEPQFFRQLTKSADDASLAPLEVAPIRIDQLDVKLLAEEKSQ